MEKESFRALIAACVLIWTGIHVINKIQEEMFKRDLQIELRKWEKSSENIKSNSNLKNELYKLRQENKTLKKRIERINKAANSIKWSDK